LSDKQPIDRSRGSSKPIPPAGIVAAARRAAIDTLGRCSREEGLRASARAYGHNQVWSRDSMISLLGGALVGDPLIERALRASLATLGRHQSSLGAIPNHVDLATGKPNFRAYADAGLWYVIGSSILQPDFQTMERVLRWYEYQDVDGSGLISMQEAADWQDLFCVRGKGLYVNCLHTIALRRTASLAEALGEGRQAMEYRHRAEAAQSAINSRLWYAGDGQLLRHVADSFSTWNAACDSLGRPRWIPAKRILLDAQYYLPYVSFRQPGEWFDTLGNLMAILAGVADERQTAHILDFIEHHGIGLYPCRSIFPSVEPGDPDWRDYYGSLNLPHCYHNGGVWPFIGGFYVAALAKGGRHAEAGRALARLAALNCNSEFCEWLHGETLEPVGVREQAWSAGMYLFATECVTARSVPFF
jgi:hypothetical protein